MGEKIEKKVITLYRGVSRLESALKKTDGCWNRGLYLTNFKHEADIYAHGHSMRNKESPVTYTIRIENARVLDLDSLHEPVEDNDYEKLARSKDCNVVKGENRFGTTYLLFDTDNARIVERQVHGKGYRCAVCEDPEGFSDTCKRFSGNSS